MTVFDDGALEGRGALKNNYFSEDFFNGLQRICPSRDEENARKTPV